MNKDSKRAVLLMNLGSPDSTSVQDVKKYLREFLMDERVIDVPVWWRHILVKVLIIPFRAPKSAEAYRSIWTDKGSPLIVITRELRNAVEDKTGMPVFICMRYGSPSPEAAFNIMLDEYDQLEEVILFPLYPHYAMSSYETAFEHAMDIYSKNDYPFELKTVSPYYDNPLYIKALSESIRPYLLTDYDMLLFSYHGVPERHIRKGDYTGEHCLTAADCCATASPVHNFCYRHQIIKTTNLVVSKLDIPSNKYSFSFQSRLGREEWLQPYTAEYLKLLPRQGIKKLLVVCPAFVSDCLETLEEIGQEGKHIFLESGGEAFDMIPCLNTDPLWVEAIAHLVEKNRYQFEAGGID